MGTLPGDEAVQRCYDALLDREPGAEMTLDVEGYSPLDYRRTPKLLDMAQVKGLNRCEFLRES